MERSSYHRFERGFLDAEEKIIRLLRPRFKPWRWHRIASAEALTAQVIGASKRSLPRPASISRQRRRSLRAFNRNLHKKYGRAFSFSEAAIQASTEAVLNMMPVLAFHQDQIREVGAAFQLQHAQAVRASYECIALLQAGYGQGAFAHARTVLELSISVQALAKEAENDPSSEIGRRFFDHEELVRARHALEYDTFADLLGHERDDPENQLAAQKVVDRYRAKLGSDGLKSFRQDWGWLMGRISSGSPNFREVSRYVNMEGWYNYYRLASNVTHGGTRGVVLNRVNFRGSQVPSYGPANVRLTDPAQVMLIHLLMLSSTIVSFVVGVANEEVDDADEDIDEDAGLVDRRLRQMQSLAMLEYGQEVSAKAVEEYSRVSQEIIELEEALSSSRLRQISVRNRQRLSRLVRTFFTSSSRP
jgi:hypothetical protein